jgi:hypothetical protein
MSAQLDALLEAVGAAVALPGARCRGRSALFDPAGICEDPETAAQRHTQALGLCSHCDSLARCREWLFNLPPPRRPPGVVAGIVMAAD